MGVYFVVCYRIPLPLVLPEGKRKSVLNKKSWFHCDKSHETMIFCIATVQANSLKVLQEERSIFRIILGL